MKHERQPAAAAGRRAVEPGEQRVGGVLRLEALGAGRRLVHRADAAHDERVSRGHALEPVAAVEIEAVRVAGARVARLARQLENGAPQTRVVVLHVTVRVRERACLDAELHELRSVGHDYASNAFGLGRAGQREVTERVATDVVAPGLQLERLGHRDRASRICGHRRPMQLRAVDVEGTPHAVRLEDRGALQLLAVGVVESEGHRDDGQPAQVDARGRAGFARVGGGAAVSGALRGRRRWPGSGARVEYDGAWRFRACLERCIDALGRGALIARGARLEEPGESLPQAREDNTSRPMQRFTHPSYHRCRPNSAETRRLSRSPMVSSPAVEASRAARLSRAGLR